MLKKKSLLLLIIAFLLFIIPFTVYLALTKQFIFKRAAFGTTSFNLNPTGVTQDIGETFVVRVSLFSPANLASVPITGVDVRLTYDHNLLELTNINNLIDEGAVQSGFTDEILQDLETARIVLVVNKPNDSLPTGDIPIANYSFRTKAKGTGTVSIDLNNSVVVGFNQNNEDVSLILEQGSQTSYTIIDNLCRVTACPSISLEEVARSDGKFNIKVNITSTEPNLTYKVYRNKDNPVPEGNPDTYFVETTAESIFYDGNNNQGFDGSGKYYYSADAYEVCPSP